MLPLKASRLVKRIRPREMTHPALARSLKECFVVVGILAGYLASYQYAEQVRHALSKSLSSVPAHALSDRLSCSGP